jgi:hypothetical protein
MRVPPRIESRLDPGSESGATNHGQSRVPRGIAPPMRLLRRSTPRNDRVKSGRSGCARRRPQAALQDIGLLVSSIDGYGRATS